MRCSVFSTEFAETHIRVLRFINQCIVYCDFTRVSNSMFVCCMSSGKQECTINAASAAYMPPPPWGPGEGGGGGGGG